MLGAHDRRINGSGQIGGVSPSPARRSTFEQDQGAYSRAVAWFPGDHLGGVSAIFCCEIRGSER